MDEMIEKYLHAIRLFNEQEFFECHDVLEEIWAESFGDQKTFLQGMIQASVALFHFGNENYGGARKLYVSSRERLERFPAEYLGINLLRFVADFDACFQELLETKDGYPSGIEMREERIPVIHLVDEN